MKVDKNNKHLSDQFQAFLADAARIEKEKEALRNRARMNGTFSEWDRERSLELDREERQLVERARAQGFELVIKRPLLQVIFSGIATASMLGLSAVTTMLALLFLYYFFGNIVLLLSACTLFFLAGLWFGCAVTARKFHSKIYSAFIPDDGDSNNRSDSQPQTF